MEPVGASVSPVMLGSFAWNSSIFSRRTQMKGHDIGDAAQELFRQHCWGVVCEHREGGEGWEIIKYGPSCCWPTTPVG